MKDICLFHNSMRQLFLYYLIFFKLCTTSGMNYLLIWTIQTPLELIRIYIQSAKILLVYTRWEIIFGKSDNFRESNQEKKQIGQHHIYLKIVGAEILFPPNIIQIYICQQRAVNHFIRCVLSVIFTKLVLMDKYHMMRNILGYIIVFSQIKAYCSVKVIKIMV